MLIVVFMFAMYVGFFLGPIILPIICIVAFFKTGDTNYLWAIGLVFIFYIFVFICRKYPALLVLPVCLIVGLVIFSKLLLGLLFVSEKIMQKYEEWNVSQMPLPEQKYFSYINSKNQQIIVPLNRKGNDEIVDQDRLPEKILNELAPTCQKLSDETIALLQTKKTVFKVVPVACSDFIAQAVANEIIKQKYSSLLIQTAGDRQTEIEGINIYWK